jgi:hypothetical protein
VGYIDSDCSGDWTFVDKLYLQQLWVDDNEHVFSSPSNHVVTIGDLRLYIPPVEMSDEPEPEFNPYDENQNNIIEMGEMMNAIGDWKAGNLPMGDMMEIIGYWKVGSYSS